ncbi:MAG TPA: mersacidin/lichenicidin family type 2 lantibiotic [Thermoanaerobaculia bacterium]|jgi:type 2 lantibiotic, mersacidin/lichenicidin family|nr:mersacidin/lichenicidin family type 2 lantibiotic [Thermoanaerobaculia bacterium]
MKKIDVVRAWRDEEYRNSLTPEELASLPENPAGLAVVQDSVLRSVTGGCGYQGPTTKYTSCVAPGEQCP